MKIRTTLKKNILAVIPEGKIDAETAPELEKVIEENVAGVDAVEFDMKKVEYMSSAGLRVILGLRKKNDRDGFIVMKHLNDTVRTVLELSGFTNIVTIK